MKSYERKISGTGIILLLCMLHASAADPVIVKKITFDQAREITWQNSHVLKQTDLMQLRRLEERRAARGLYFPTIGVVANAMAMSDPITLDMSPVRDAITPLYKTMGTYGKFGGIPGVSDDVGEDNGWRGGRPRAPRILRAISDALEGHRSMVPICYSKLCLTFLSLFNVHTLRHMVVFFFDVLLVCFFFFFLMCFFDVFFDVFSECS